MTTNNKAFYGIQSAGGVATAGLRGTSPWLADNLWIELRAMATTGGDRRNILIGIGIDPSAGSIICAGLDLSGSISNTTGYSHKPSYIIGRLTSGSRLIAADSFVTSGIVDYPPQFNCFRVRLTRDLISSPNKLKVDLYGSSAVADTPQVSRTYTSGVEFSPGMIGIVAIGCGIFVDSFGITVASDSHTVATCGSCS
ncbi:MAG: hypothetical protein D0530_04760 [Methylococcales bacterium]|nr:MAG: hypothetical protein D0530_04760 [Methylococcales bacterium]